MSFRPLHARDKLWASLLVLALIALALLMLRAIMIHPIGPGTVIAGLVMLLAGGASGMLIYRLWALHTLDYWVQRDAIHIHWNGEEVIIPLTHIRRIEQAHEFSLSPQWLHWPEPWIQSQKETHVLAYTTQPPHKSLAIITNEAAYLISPAQPEAFITAYEQRREFGPARKLKPVIYLSPWRQHWLWHDRQAQALLFGGLLLGLILLGYTAWHYPQLPATIALHFDRNGHPDLLSPRRAIFLIPGAALLFGFLNASMGYVFYESRRFIAYLLWGASVLIQVLGGYIVIRIIQLATG